MSGLFATLNTSKTGMFAQQQFINTTSHNISNANTPGFSRQHVVLQTARPQTIAGGIGQIGTGVSMVSIERTRNQFLDYQIRKEGSHLGIYGVRQEYLSQVEGIFNEPSDTGISELMSQFFDAWQTLSKNPDKSDARTVVAQKAKALMDEINHTYKKLDDTKNNAIQEIQSSLFDINTTLDQLNSVNKEIITVTIAGNNPNDLLDRRDALLDELSTKFGIDTKSQSLNGVTCKPEGNDLINFIKNKDSEPVNKLGYVSQIKETATAGEYEVSYYKNGDTTSEKNKVTQTIKLSPEQHKALSEGRVIITNEDGSIAGTNTGNLDAAGNPIITINSKHIFNPPSGELGGLQSVSKDVDGYIDQVNTLAKSIAFAVNAVHAEGIDPKVPFFVDSTTIGKTGLTFEQQFENVTAANITINPDLLKDVMKIQTGANSGSGSTDGDRALAIAGLRDYALNIAKIQGGGDYNYTKFVAEHFDVKPNGVPTSKPIASGTKIESFFKNTINKLGVQSQEASRIVKNQGSLLKGLLERRLSTSGVSLDEEAINLVQFQHAFQANAKVISTVDQLLDVVIGLVR
ncbi:MAG: flagellar hook-associated protein FlgK [Clostridium sp.]|uniref:flagellar hook-associated protein FlgK n=1 Tax=Clostridium sp. TaxID=1506 RepID=UPI003063675F